MQPIVNYLWKRPNKQRIILIIVCLIVLLIVSSSVAIIDSARQSGGQTHTPTPLARITGTIPATNTAPPRQKSCPSSWNCQDIGAPALSGGQAYNPATGTWSLNGGGYDIFYAQDQFHYAWQTMSGSGSFTAKITSQTDTDDSAKAGIMIRATTDQGSIYYAVVVMPKFGAMVQFRAKNGQGTNEKFPSASWKNNAPIYLQIQREGNTFSGYYSKDAVNWTLIPNSVATIDMPSTALAGLAICSHNTKNMGIATFQQVNIA